jgi:S-(hydroxymethyl)glutathione dehydrogenase/alcohol dehydrogenase
VFHGPGRPLDIQELEVAEPAPGEVLVQLAAAGVCHSDYHVAAGEWTAPVPLVLGHEGAGRIAAVGERVAELNVGDPVVLSWCPSCGRCEFCLTGRPQLCEVVAATTYGSVMYDGSTRLRDRGASVHAYLSVGSFAEYAVVPEMGAVAIQEDVPLDQAALVGCAAATGFGAVVNTARVRVGASVAVIGCGGVGLSAVQGARAASARAIIAIDVNDAKLQLASSLGATHTVNASLEEPVQSVMRLSAGRGVEFAFEAIGLAQTVEQAAAMLAAGGTAVLIGQAAEGVKISLDPSLISDREHKIIGSNYGSCRPHVDFPRILDLHRTGVLDLEALISRRIALEEVDEAFAAMAAGETVRSVIVFESRA